MNMAIKDKDLKKKLIDMGIKQDSEIEMDGNKLVEPTREEALALLGLKEGNANTEPTTKKYPLTDNAKRNAYFGVIDGREIVIDFERNFKGEPNSMYSSVGHFEGSNPNRYFKSDNVDYLEDLTPKQIKELAYAGVIKVTKEDKQYII